VTRRLNPNVSSARIESARTCAVIRVKSALFQQAPQDDSGMKKWQCIVCGFIYDEAEGWPDDGIAAGTRWEDVPADWMCPECGVGKAEFEMVELTP
jgi:rubredoxin